MVHDQSPQGPKRYRNLLHATREIYSEFGLARGFLGGISPTVAKVALCNAIRFAGFGNIADRLRTRPGRPGGAAAPLNPLETMTAGGLAGAISAVVSQPIDVVRANMMGLDASALPGLEPWLLDSHPLSPTTGAPIPVRQIGTLPARSAGSPSSAGVA
eukprot:179083-Prymnesium_polylepis.1